MRILKLSVITIAVLIGAFVLLLSSVFIYKRYIYDGERFFVSKANLKSYSNLLNASEMRLNAKEVHGVEKGSRINQKVIIRFTENGVAMLSGVLN